MKNIIIGIVVLAVVVAGGFVLFSKKTVAPAASSATNTPSSSSSSSPSQAPTAVKSVSATITYTNDGFSPAKLTVKSGDIIAVKNNSSNSLQFSSDPHPIHTGDPEINQNTLPAGGSSSFMVKVKGTHGFHNHLDPSKTGTIVVE